MEERKKMNRHLLDLPVGFKASKNEMRQGELLACFLLNIQSVFQSPNVSSNFAGKLNAWIGTVGAVKNRSSLIGIGHIKIVEYYWRGVDFAGLLGQQESKISQRVPSSLPAYLVSTSSSPLIKRMRWLERSEVVLSW